MSSCAGRGAFGEGGREAFAGARGATPEEERDLVAAIERAEIVEEIDGQFLVLARLDVLCVGGEGVDVDGASDRATLDPRAEEPFGLQRGEVLADGHRGDAEGVGELIGGEPCRASQRIEDLPSRCAVSSFRHSHPLRARLSQLKYSRKGKGGRRECAKGDGTGGTEAQRTRGERMGWEWS